MIFDPFLDPAPAPRLVGLQRGRCERCAGPALVDADYAGRVLCSHCRPAPRALYAPARFAGGAAPAGDSAMWSRSNRDRDGNSISVHLSPSPTRILVPAREASPGQMPSGALALADAARRAGRAVSVTYALAEQSGAAMLASVAVRIRNGEPVGAGYGIWINDRYAGGQWRTPARWHAGLGVGELTALATGADWTPPAPRPPAPKGPCPRCGAVVRWTTSGNAGPRTYAHKRTVLRGEGGDFTIKEPCQ